MATRADTIAALASGPPPAALCVLRVSGSAVRALAGSRLSGGLPPERSATLTRLCDENGQMVDEGLAIFFAGPRSFTGEDTLELTLHGGRAVIEHALQVLMSFPGVRLAEPGEFARRAFEMGKFDLIQAEGIADLIEAETLAQKAQAQAQMTGELSKTYDAWRSALTDMLALIEVSVDFPEESDAPQDTSGPLALRITALIADFDAALGDGGIGEKIRDGFRIALVGAPNAGKSTLMNQLAKRDAAIVTALPGTTRDVIDVRRMLGGQIVWISDTAGLRETDDAIEREGIRRAEAAARDADLRLFLIDASNPDLSSLESGFRLPHDWIVVNKTDLTQAPSSIAFTYAISAAKGEGLIDLERGLETFIQSRSALTEPPVITRLRHRRGLEAARASLCAAQDGLHAGRGAEFVAEDVRRAISCLATIVGSISTEDVLGAVFSRFCIGK
jgi:tRNA modification GTPase